MSGRFSEVWGWYLRSVGDLTAFLDEPDAAVPAGLPEPGPQPIEASDVTFT